MDQTFGEKNSNLRTPGARFADQCLVQKFSDEKLFELCKKYGAAALEARRKFLGLLPEVARRKLYEKKGFGSIFEFAAKLSGISREHVQRVLQLEKNFEDKPVLKEILVNGEVSSNKLIRIQSIATPENQEFLAQQVRLLSQSAIETMVRDVRVGQQSVGMQTSIEPGNLANSAGNKNGLSKTSSAPITLRAHSLRLDDDVEKELEELQKKGIDINKLIREMLVRRKQEIVMEKERISADVRAKGPTNSRYIPVATKKILIKEFGTKCTISTCGRSAENIHHTQKFALSHTHDPNFLAPLCKDHHQIGHSIDVKFHEVRRGRAR